jgi:hypothetical protein
MSRLPMMARAQGPDFSNSCRQNENRSLIALAGATSTRSEILSDCFTNIDLTQRCGCSSIQTNTIRLWVDRLSDNRRRTEFGLAFLFPGRGETVARRDEGVSGADTPAIRHDPLLGVRSGVSRRFARSRRDAARYLPSENSGGKASR